MSHPHRTRFQARSQNPSLVIEGDDDFPIDIGVPTQQSEPARHDTSSEEGTAHGAVDMEVDYENLTLEELEKELAAKEAEKKKREIIQKLKGLNNPSQDETRSEDLDPETLALRRIEATRLHAPREDTRIKTFHGRSTQEYDTFQNRLRNYFDTHPVWFAYSPHKVLAASQYLADDRHNEWQSHVEKLTRQPTWEEFQDFCLRFVNDPESIYRDAVRDYHRAYQKPTQSVREFATQLDGIHRRLRHPYGDVHRKEHLWAKVQEQVRSEAMKYPEQPETYDGYIAHLCTVESQIPERKRATKNEATRFESKNDANLSSRITNDNSGARAKSNTGPRPAGMARRGRNHEKNSNGGSDERNRGFKRKREDHLDTSATSHPYITCHHCQKKGHYAHSCPSAPMDQSPKTKNG